ncbi:MAG: hypothetical protein O3A55_06315 [Bacteroidetes bacterium]|nr:hypothetical protein [Bacteroidota bacterium]
MKKYFLFVPLLFLSCDENLPIYSEPEKVIEANLKPFYSYSQTSNQIIINFVVKNVFDETFDGKAKFSGEINIVNQKFGKSKTIKLDYTYLSIQNGYNRATGRLILHPGDSLVFQYKWDFLFDDSTHLFSLLNYKKDPNCQARQISNKVENQINGFVTVFNNLPNFYSKTTEFNFCHIDAYIPPKDCQIISPATSCLE